jgi:hypothetical protein
MGAFEVKGGDKAKAALQRIADAVGKGAVAKVGFFQGATEADGTSVPMIAAIQEYGAPKRNIPPRPFFRQAINARADAWAKNIATALKRTDYDAKTAMELVGQGAKEDIQKSIIDTMAPPLSDVTVMLRGMRLNDPGLTVSGKTVGEAAARVAAGKTNYGAPTKPLIDTSTMLNSVGVEVE